MRNPNWMNRTLAVVVWVGANSAAAGVVDSPLPNLQTGQTTRHVFTVTGVVKNNNLETDFMCTSLEATATVRFGVEVFTASGGAPLNNVNEGTADGVADLAPGGSATIGTGGTTVLHEDQIIGAVPAGSLKNSSARIVSTSTRISCTAIAVDKTATVFQGYPLKVITKKKQIGD